MNVPLTPLRFKIRALSLYANKIGVICDKRRFTYREFFERCDALSHGLQNLGVSRGNRVAFLSFNCHRLLEAYYGVVQLGAVLLPMNVRLSKQEFIYILNDSEAKVLFFDADFGESVAEIRPSLKTVRHLIPLNAHCAAVVDTIANYETLLAGAKRSSFDPAEIDEDDVAELFYTSGTTANPKGVMLTHRNLYLHALSILIAMGTRDADIHLHTIPLFHVNGWGTPQSVTCMGGTHVMLRRFDPAQVLQLIVQEKVTTMSLVPTMANALLCHPDLGKHDYSSLKTITLGGAAPSVSMVRKMEEAFGCTCYTGYGLTETCPVLTLATPKASFGDLANEERYRIQAMTGIPLVGVEIRVVDEQGKDVPPDGFRVGEVIARGDCVMKGYWNQASETHRVIRDGWFYTGDMGSIDPEGYLLIVDRKKDIIISGGENIASIEIEKCLLSHPAILECAVIAVPDPQWGEVPKGLVVLQPGNEATEAEIIQHCRKHIAGYKCPRSIDFLDELPKGGTGKILKRSLRERYWADHQRRVQG